MQRVIKQYICDRCGAVIAENDMQHTYPHQPSTPFVGRCGNRTFLIRNRIAEQTWRGSVNRTVFMCQSCWDALNSLYEKFMAEGKR